MQNLYEDLKDLLAGHEQYIKDGKPFKNKIVEDALKLEPTLIKTLLTHDSLKKHFFQEVEGILVFDKVKFQKFVNNKQFLPDSYTQYKNKIGLTAEGEYLTESKEVVLSWAYKDCVLEGGQTKEDQKRKEIFWNETLAPDEIDRLFEPKVFTNWKRYDKDGEHEVKNISLQDNLIIKGNNLLALHSLKKMYRGKVKLIYIDPPYNTGNDSFRYNDSFNHSTWLSFMKNRLEIAKELLADNGVIFIHLDQIEEAYLKILMDEILGRENFVNVVAVRSSTPSGTKTKHKDRKLIKQKDLLLVYRKSESARFNPQYKRKPSWDTHFNFFLDRKTETVRSFIDVLLEKGVLPKGSKLRDFDINDKKHRKFYLENSTLICQTQSHKNKELKQKSKDLQDKVLFINKGEKDEVMFYNGRQLTPLSNSLNDVLHNNKIEKDFSMLLCDFWDDIDFQNTQNEGGVSLTNGKKPEELLYRIINLATAPNDIVLDFFVGSGTTSCVALKMNRRFIGIEQLDYIEELPTNRLINVIQGEKSGISKALKWQGGGSFIYTELAQDNQTYIDRIARATDSKQLLTIWEDMRANGFLSYRITPKEIDKAVDDFTALSLDDQKKFLVEILDKNQLYVNYCDIDNGDYEMSEADKKLNNRFYNLK